MINKYAHIPRKFIFVISLLFLFVLIQSSSSAKIFTRNLVVNVNKVEVVYRFNLVLADPGNDKQMAKCLPAPSRQLKGFIRKKPKLGRVKVNRDAKFKTDWAPCKGKEVKGIAIEYISSKRGKDTFRVQIIWDQPGHSFTVYEDITFNVTVR